jgi:hypothetical protein
MNSKKRDDDMKNGVVLNASGRLTLKATSSVFDGAPYLNLRYWTEGNTPCKQGVTFGYDGWLHMKAFMAPEQEFDVCVSATVLATSNAVSENRKASCEGCRVDHPSQNQHPCLMDPITEAECLESLDRLKPWNVILEMAEQAQKKQFALKQPLKMFELVRSCMADEIVSKVKDL